MNREALTAELEKLMSHVDGFALCDQLLKGGLPAGPVMNTEAPLRAKLAANVKPVPDAPFVTTATYSNSFMPDLLPLILGVFTREAHRGISSVKSVTRPYPVCRPHRVERHFR